MEAVFVILALVGFGVLVTTINRTSTRRHQERWQLAADFLDLELERIGSELFRVHGELDGFPVEIDVYFVKTRRGHDRYTRYRVFYENLGLGLRLRRQKGWTKAIASLTGADLDVGDAEFDRAVLVRGDDDAVRSFLTPTRRVAFLFLLQDYPDVVAEDDVVRWMVKGVKEDGQAVAGHLQNLVEGTRRFIG
jgi:hypothetical protein